MAEDVTNYDYGKEEMQGLTEGQEENKKDSLSMFNDEAPKDWRNEEKEEQKSNTELTVKDVEPTKVKTTDSEGNEMAPNESKDGKHKWYQSKLKVIFEEKTSSGLTLVEYYPHLKYFVRNDGSVSETPVIPRYPEVVVGKLFNLFLDKTGYQSKEVSDQDFIKWLRGKKVRVVPEKIRGVTRNDIVDAYEPEQSE